MHMPSHTSVVEPSGTLFDNTRSDRASDICICRPIQWIARHRIERFVCAIRDESCKGDMTKANDSTSYVKRRNQATKTENNCSLVKLIRFNSPARLKALRLRLEASRAL